MFNELPPDSPAIGDVAMNFTANAFGLANAATPFGIKAMEELQKESDNNNVVTVEETNKDVIVEPVKTQKGGKRKNNPGDSSLMNYVKDALDNE